jgi:5'-nucleotidase
MTICTGQLGAITVLLSLIGTPAMSAYGQDEPYHILVTNDDGVESPGILALAEALRSVGQVHVIAPCNQRSGASMSVSLRDELSLRPVPRDGGVVDHCVDTTPAGTVLLAMGTLAPPGGFDLVVSGINAGANLGTASHMSGTIGAAMMGAFHDVPAVAVSTGARGEYRYAAQFTATFIARLKREPALPGIVLSVNVPHDTEAETAGVAFAKMGNLHFQVGYQEQEGEGEGDVRRFRPTFSRASAFTPGGDSEAYMQDMITITPLVFDWTGYAVLDQMGAWDLSHEVGP